MQAVLAVDIGNAEIKCGIFCSGQLTFCCRLASEPKWTADQYTAQLRMVFAEKCMAFDGAVLSSVVPGLTHPLSEVAGRLCRHGGENVMTVGPGIKTGLDIRVDNPVNMGSDFVCGAIGAMSLREPPLIVFDFGTATTLTAVDRDGALVGRLILAGMQTALDALTEKTACLPAVRLPQCAPKETRETVRGFFGRTTVDAMEKGILLGNAEMVDGLFARCRALLGEDLGCIFTGGCAQAAAAVSLTPARIEPHLQLYGLYAIWMKNRA